MAVKRTHPPPLETAPPPHPPWPLGQAKARFSQVVRLARSGEPQRVTVHGRDAVVVVATSDFERLVARGVSPSLHQLLSESPLHHVEAAEVQRRGRFREVDE